MSSLNSWTETILFSIGFILILGFLVAGMNSLYNQDNNIPIIGNNSLNEFEEYLGNSTNTINEGEVVFNQEQGITLKSSYALVKGLLSIIWNFITGGWINDVISLLNLGDVGYTLALLLRILYFVSVILALLYILFKVVP